MINLQKTLPVLASIVIILVLAVLRDRSRTLAAILSTMPINMVLALWIVSSGSDRPTSMLPFVRSLLVGMAPTLLWLVAIFFALRSGWSLAGAIVAGYAVWGALIALAFRLGIFSV
jgi:uncharacterized membrane protein (GlpM family)